MKRFVEKLSLWGKEGKIIKSIDFELIIFLKKRMYLFCF